MIEKADLEVVFEAWYDHKMAPGDKEMARVHRSTLDNLRVRLEAESGQCLDLGDLRHALWPRFGQWMRERSLPSPPKDR